MKLYVMNEADKQPMLVEDENLWAEWMDATDRVIDMAEGHMPKLVWRLRTFFPGVELDTAPGGPWFFATEYSSGPDRERLQVRGYLALSRTYEQALRKHGEVLAHLRAVYLARSRL